MPTRGSIDLKVMGAEPEAPIIIDENDVALVKILNWYNYFHTIQDSKKWIVEWMKKNNYTKEEQEKFEKAPDTETPLHIASLCRMLNRGAILPEIYINKIKSNICHCINFKKEKKVDVIFEKDVMSKIDVIVSEIDYFLDKLYKDYKFSDPQVYDLLEKETPSAQQSSKVLDYYEALLKELLQYKDDAVIREAYDHLSPQDLNASITVLKLIISDITRYRDGNKVERIYKPRKKKEIPVSILLKNLKYQIEDSSIGIKSIDPKQIIGATQVWLYNTKYKKLTKLVAENQNSLTVKGTTILNYSEKESESKTLRKPDVVIASVLQASKPQLKHILSNLTTKPSPITGRVNEDTIILRAIK